MGREYGERATPLHRSHTESTELANKDVGVVLY